MAHYAFLDKNNIVINVIVGKDENEDGINWEEYYSEQTGEVCKRTSFNTVGNIHRLGGTPYRYNYASEGYFFDETFGIDGAFIPPKPFPSWVLNDTTCVWQAPLPKPQDIEGSTYYRWNEDLLNWVIDPVISKE